MTVFLFRNAWKGFTLSSVNNSSVEHIYPNPYLNHAKGRPNSNMAAANERDLVRKILSGDQSAFESLLDQYEKRVYRLALRFTGAPSDAEDVTQNIFLGIYRGLASFRGSSSLNTWIYRIAMNHCMEFQRRRKLDNLPLEEELALVVTDWRNDPEQSAEKRELSDRLEQAIAKLRPLHREVIVLHELQGLTYLEVAGSLNVPVGTVKSRLSNAFKHLRELLGSYVFDQE